MSTARTRAERELAEIEQMYAGSTSQYAVRAVRAVKAARTLVAEAERDHEAADEMADRTIERLRAEIAQLKAGTTLDQRIAVLEDNELLVRVDFDRPKLGWELHHLEAMALRLRMAGAEDRTKLDLSNAKVSGNAPNSGIINLDVDADRRERDWAREKPPAMPPGDDSRAGHPLPESTFTRLEAGDSPLAWFVRRPLPAQFALIVAACLSLTAIALGIEAIVS